MRSVLQNGGGRLRGGNTTPKVRYLVRMKPGGFCKSTRLRIVSGIRLGDESGECGNVERFVSDMEHAMGVSAKCTKSVEKGKTKFLCARKEEDAEAFAAGKSDNVASHGFS